MSIYFANLFKVKKKKPSQRLYCRVNIYYLRFNRYTTTLLTLYIYIYILRLMQIFDILNIFHVYVKHLQADKEVKKIESRKAIGSKKAEHER